MCSNMKTSGQARYIAGLYRQGKVSRHDACANVLLCFEEANKVRNNAIRIYQTHTGGRQGYNNVTSYSVAYNQDSRRNIASVLPTMSMCKESKSGRVYVYLEELLSACKEAFPHSRITIVVEACRTPAGGIHSKLEHYSPREVLPSEGNNGTPPSSTGSSPTHVMVHVTCHGLQQGEQYVTENGVHNDQDSTEMDSNRTLEIIETNQRYYNGTVATFHKLYDQVQDEIRRRRLDLNITLEAPGPDALEQAYVDATGNVLKHTLFFKRLLLWKQQISNQPMIQSLDARDIKAVVMQFASPLHFSLYSGENTDVIFCAEEGTQIASGVFSNWTVGLLIHDLLNVYRQQRLD